MNSYHRSAYYCNSSSWKRYEKMVAKHELLSSFYITATYLLMKNKLVSEAWTHIIVPIVLQQLQGFCTCADFNEERKEEMEEEDENPEKELKKWQWIRTWTHIIVLLYYRNSTGVGWAHENCPLNMNSYHRPTYLLLLQRLKPIIMLVGKSHELLSLFMLTFVANVHEPPTVVLRITATICKVWKRSHTWAFYHRSTYFTATLMRIRKRIIGITKRTCSDIIGHIPSCPNIITTLWKVKRYTWTLIIISK